jgi:hypothetical protein
MKGLIIAGSLVSLLLMGNTASAQQYRGEVYGEDQQEQYDDGKNYENEKADDNRDSRQGYENDYGQYGNDKEEFRNNERYNDGGAPGYSQRDGYTPDYRQGGGSGRTIINKNEYGASNYDRVAAQQFKVRRLKRMAFADGIVTYREKQMLTYEQQKLNRMRFGYQRGY